MLEGIATLHELETWYSIDDIADRNDALDALDEAKRRAQARRK
jgi:hypothetical protein